ncbi:unnamed protein product [Acanthoscelides obtectus]|uniref:Uncharacterized protein n=1 Tax=Acanthoscelides obtectus TaxID=200917 RepID=A0A9P0K1H9_ACAOB|nr:unnamed protein product [Acanthoscelides obtectus]CAK1656989.1 hypothetical protein AOBTE_LOCUS20063 [Acanthoscelides obtectus]
MYEAPTVHNSRWCNKCSPPIFDSKSRKFYNTGIQKLVPRCQRSLNVMVMTSTNKWLAQQRIFGLY